MADLIKQEIHKKCSDSLMRLSKDDKFYEINLSSIKTERAESMEAAEKKQKKKRQQKELYMII